MKDYKRNIDTNKMNQSKQRTINFIMNEIEQQEYVKESKKPNTLFNRYAISFATILILFTVLIFQLDFTGQPPTPTPPEFDTYEQTGVVETSYIAGSVLAQSINGTLELPTMFMSHSLYKPLNTLSELEIGDYEAYFNILIGLHDHSDLDSVQVTALEDSVYNSKIEFTQNGVDFIFLVTITDTTFTGILTLEDITFNVEGTIEESETFVMLELKAENGSDYIKIKYESEKEEEVEKKYEIEQQINGVYSEKEIKIEYDPDFKMELTENENSFELKQIEFNNQLIYKFEYEVDGVSAELFVIETLDPFGNIIYQYVTEEEFEQENEEEDEENETDDQNSPINNQKFIQKV